MPLTTLMSIGTAIAGASGMQPIIAPLGIIENIIMKMSRIKVPFLRRLLGRRSRVMFAYMPKYRQFIQQVTKEKLKEKYLLIDFEDYCKTILSEDEVKQFNNFVNDKSDNDLYKEIVGEMVNRLFNNDLSTSKKIIYFTDNEKLFRLIRQKRKVYIYPRIPEDSEMKAMYISMIENIKRHIILYKSFTDLEDLMITL